MAIQPIGPEQTRLSLPSNSTGKSDGSFAENLMKSIRNVNNIQSQADQAISNLLTGKQENLHQTMIAMEKASLSFELIMQVRNKILAAYDEISRMQI
ncbi:MAG: flagellar hook-basal body complex protein FliE [Candidatus Manganitrophaceae bacterium]